MEKTNSESQGMIKLDLEKYNLSHLANVDSSDWSTSDIEIIMQAFASEDIAPAILGIPFKPQTVRALLNVSYCRRCGRCCIPSPITPDHPGVMVFKEDLINISRRSTYSYKFLKKKAIFNTNPDFPLKRYLPLPCIFFNKQKFECQIYDSRPLVCETFPISDVTNQVGISIDLRCDYGKDIYRHIITSKNM